MEIYNRVVQGFKKIIKNDDDENNIFPKIIKSNSLQDLKNLNDIYKNE